MTQKAYLVLSVKDIREMLRVAEKSRESHGPGTHDLHCVVFDFEVKPDINGNPQACCVDFLNSCAVIERSANFRAMQVDTTQAVL